MGCDALGANVALEQVWSASIDGVFVLDELGRCVLFSSGCERLTGLSSAAVLGMDWRTGADDVDGPAEVAILAKLSPDMSGFTAGTELLRRQLRFRRGDGVLFTVQAQYTPLRDEQDGLRGVIGVLHRLNAVGCTEADASKLSESVAAGCEELRLRLRENYGFASILSADPVMGESLARIRSCFDHDSPTLLIGEAGTGKETAARTIHRHSQRGRGRFVGVNCTARRDRIEQEIFGCSGFDGLIRTADRGTFYLDGLEAIPPDVQARLLRVVQHGQVRSADSGDEHAVDVRIIASTRRSPEEVVTDGRLREDLACALGVVRIEFPALRQRRGDIPYLVQQRLSNLNLKATPRKVESIDPGVWAWLMRYSWPGNLRELNAAVESAFALGSGPRLMPEDLPHLIRGERLELEEASNRLDQPLDHVLASVERRAILTALRRTDGRRSQAAREMGISRSRLYRRMEALGIHPREDL